MEERDVENGLYNDFSYLLTSGSCLFVILFALIMYLSWYADDINHHNNFPYMGVSSHSCELQNLEIGFYIDSHLNPRFQGDLSHYDDLSPFKCYFVSL